ncbi:MAG: DUF541 domain-containing protein [Candidatus Staskawiczbacteria bacterium]|nr:DUF541 domain-containing protein [Candidatus Staskawiczbacteria bacterium]
MEANFNTEIKAGMETNHTLDISDRLYKIILAVIALVVVYIIGQMMYDFKALPQNYPREIYVSGEGKAYAKPDIAIINFGVTAESAKSQDAVNKSNEKMNAVIKAIKDLGVEDKDIKTTSYNLYPTYGSDRAVDGYGGGGSIMPMYYPVQSNKIIGYRLDQQVEVKVRNLDNINQIIDKVTSAGANNVSSPQFTVDDIESVREEARLKAIEQAKEKAEKLAKQSGLKIDRLMNISEGYNYAYGLGGASVAKESMPSSPAPQIEPGQSEITISVNLTYRIK